MTFKQNYSEIAVKIFHLIFPFAGSLNKSIEMAKRYSEKYQDLRYEYLNKAAALSARQENFTNKSSLKSCLDDVEKVLTEIEEELEKTDKEHQGRKIKKNIKKTESGFMLSPFCYLPPNCFQGVGQNLEIGCPNLLEILKLTILFTCK